MNKKNRMLSIKELAENIQISPAILRSWEKKFPHLHPLKLGNLSTRYYRPDDISYVKKIYLYIYKKGYSTKGLLNLIKENGYRAFISDDENDKLVRHQLKKILLDLQDLKKYLS